MLKHIMLKQSIRKYLLVYLLVGLALVTALSILGNLYLEHHNVQNKLDFELELSAHTMASLLKHNASTQQLNAAQDKIESIPNAIRATHTANGIANKNLNLLIQSQQFQIWDSNNRLILHSYAAPSTPLASNHVGFANAMQDDIAWRTYTLYMPQEGYHIVVLQRQDFRFDIEKQLTEDSITILIVASPFFALLIWIIVGQGLSSLNRLAQSVKRRKTQNLKPLSTRKVPEEIQPLVDELNRLLHELDEALEREKRFSANAAHELRTPLAALLAQVQVALHAHSLDETKTVLKKVMLGAERSTHVVEQLLTLSRMTPHADHNTTCPIDLRLLCQNIIAEMLHQADRKHITLSLDCEERSYTVKGNEGMLMIMLRNLIDNAIRYSPSHSAVHLCITTQTGCTTLHIIDSGPGLSKADKKRAFERFFRVLGSKESGSGLGLAIVKQIIHLHQARIQLLTPTQHSGLDVAITFKTYKKTKK